VEVTKGCERGRMLHGSDGDVSGVFRASLRESLSGRRADQVRFGGLSGQVRRFRATR